MSDILNDETVMRIFSDSYHRNHDHPSTQVIVKNATGASRRFHKQRLESHRAEIKAMLRELPEASRRPNSGLQWNQVYLDKNGLQWAHSADMMDNLIVLGIAIGQAEYVFPSNIPYADAYTLDRVVVVIND